MMLFHEWSLVLFTVLAQAAIGMLLVSELARMVTGNHAGKAFSWQLPVVCVVAVSSLIFSLTHLGTPTHSFFTIMNIGSSWLSREIVATGAFVAFALGLACVRMKSHENKATFLSAGAIILGLGSVYAMSRVYMLKTVPVWDGLSTMLGFYGTMLVVGAVAGGIVFAVQSRRVLELSKEDRDLAMKVFIFAAVSGVGLKFVGIPLDMISLDASNSLGVSGLSILVSSGLGLLVVRTLLLFVGIVLFVWGAYKVSITDGYSSMLTFGICACAFVFAGEVLGRLMFYGTYLRVGL
ncbi:hypothetical protein D0S45_16820 [Marinifilum sp. JC120]|nr:hypothetical protein D0S45_16820 [Marinifilum sp. JC120]